MKLKHTLLAAALIGSSAFLFAYQSAQELDPSRGKGKSASSSWWPTSRKLR